MQNEVFSRTPLVHPFESKFRILRTLGRYALFGLGAACIAVVTAALNGPEVVAGVLGGIAALLIVPFLIFFCVMPILHWKARYRGEHSDIWGVLLLLQFNGLAALVYFFRHARPDMKGLDRYTDSSL